MTPEEIKAKATEVAALYIALANGKTLQFDTSPNQSRMNKWEDAPEELSLCIHSDLPRWRVKPDPRTFWVSLNESGDVVDSTRHPERAERWRKHGFIVIETVEVLP